MGERKRKNERNKQKKTMRKLKKTWKIIGLINKNCRQRKKEEK